jgi:hypothetical protein
MSLGLPSGSQYEHWLMVEANGTIKYHCENDGYAFFRRGAEAVDEIWSLDRFKIKHPDNVALIEALLASEKRR